MEPALRFPPLHFFTFLVKAQKGREKWELAEVEIFKLIEQSPGVLSLSHI